MNLQELINNRQPIDPKENPNDANRPDAADDRPHTPDDEFKDQGSSVEKDEVSQQNSINREELPELDHETTKDYQQGGDAYKPTDLDVDESKG